MAYSNLPNHRVDIWLLCSDMRVNISTLELSRYEKIRSSRFVHVEDKRRYQNVHTKLRLLLAAYLEISPASVVYRYGHQGKPDIDYAALSQQTVALQDLKFSLSHSGSHSLVAVMRAAELGVDVERIRALANAQQLLAAISHPRERQIISDSNPSADDFFNIWVCKEALLKALGVGLKGDMNSFSIMTGDEPQQVHFSAPYQDWHAHRFQPQPNLRACVVSNAPCVQLKQYNFERDFKID